MFPFAYHEHFCMSLTLLYISLALLQNSRQIGRISCKIRFHSESSCQIFSICRPRSNNFFFFKFFPKLHKIETVGTATSKTLAHFALIVCAVILCGKKDTETSIHLALEGKHRPQRHVRLSICGRETVYTTQLSHLNVSCPLH